MSNDPTECHTGGGGGGSEALLGGVGWHPIHNFIFPTRKGFKILRWVGVPNPPPPPPPVGKNSPGAVVGVVLEHGSRWGRSGRRGRTGPCGGGGGGGRGWRDAVGPGPVARNSHDVESPPDMPLGVRQRIWVWFGIGPVLCATR